MDKLILAVAAEMRDSVPNKDKVWTLGVYNSTIHEWADRLEKIVNDNKEKPIEWPWEVIHAQRFFRDVCIMREDEKWSEEQEWKYIKDHFNVIVIAFNALIEMIENKK